MIFFSSSGSGGLHMSKEFSPDSVKAMTRGLGLVVHKPLNLLVRFTFGWLGP